MIEELSDKAKDYIKTQGLTVSDIRNRAVLRPETGFNLSLNLINYGRKILCTNNDSIAIIYPKDNLKMYDFNRYVQRALRLPSKAEVLVIVDKNKSRMYGIRHADRFLPFNSIRGFPLFTFG